MKFHWLNSRLGINFVAIGLVAAIFAGLAIMAQDAVFLVSGVWPRLPWYRDILYHLLAAIAAIFSVVSFFTLRPGWPKFAAAAVMISFSSYVVQPFVPIHPAELIALCTARVLVLICIPLLMARVYSADLKARRVLR